MKILQHFVPERRRKSAFAEKNLGSFSLSYCQVVDNRGMGALKQGFKHAFSLGDKPHGASSNGESTEHLPTSLKKLALSIVARGLETPAILFLESIRPLHFLSAQALFAAQPFAELFVDSRSYREVVLALEKRHTLSMLIEHIETLSFQSRAKSKQK
jgi:hypothetical protein